MRNGNRRECKIGSRFTWNATEYPIRLFHVKHAICEVDKDRPNGFHVKRNTEKSRALGTGNFAADAAGVSHSRGCRVVGPEPQPRKLIPAD
jgi:hypothetical protein